MKEDHPRRSETLEALKAFVDAVQFDVIDEEAFLNQRIWVAGVEYTIPEFMEKYGYAGAQNQRRVQVGLKGQDVQKQGKGRKTRTGRLR